MLLDLEVKAYLSTLNTIALDLWQKLILVFPSLDMVRSRKYYELEQNDNKAYCDSSNNDNYGNTNNNNDNNYDDNDDATNDL